MVEYVHTTRGAELKLLERDTGAERRVLLEPATLPPGIIWRIEELAFSPGGSLLAVQSVGGVAVLDAATGEVRYRIAGDAEKQTYPGKLSLTEDRLAVSFWPPESYLADAVTKQPVAVRIYEAATGKLVQEVSLPIESSNHWTEFALSPDGTRLAVLLRATRWPGKAHLRMVNTADGKPLWEHKASAEDLSWLNDGKQLLVLGGKLAWLDASSGKTLRDAEKHVRFSELQMLRESEAGNLAVGHLAHYNPLRRGLFLSDRRDTRIMVWRLDNGKAICEIGPRPSEGADVWPTARGELIALEEQYDIRPPLKLLRSAVLVTYRVELSEGAAPKSPSTPPKASPAAPTSSSAPRP
jgi:dipeptidyl aminopeptidase/acylaminoacyl peptidase